MTPVPAFRIGLGHDTHRLGPGSAVLIGGVEIPHDRRALGHSDADVLLHAITDALLGAAALGDIGELFPDTDPANKGRDSAEMLRAAVDRVAAAGFRIVNLDCVIFAQRPKILPHRPRIVARIAALLDVDPTAVWIKAKTGEGVGPIGLEEAISAECVVLLERAGASGMTAR
ncbi:MAG: 2-C-methyl-D-erythritol 2,4-cyclodiphosphate synthase [Planctomycetota bacterium]|jgi:2-C-methyl-D-erythritol 2,4-cyclodiphosphate synthase